MKPKPELTINDLPPREEWDFRSIEGEEAYSAIAWEYALENHDVKKRMVDWLNTDYNVWRKRHFPEYSPMPEIKTFRDFLRRYNEIPNTPNKLSECKTIFGHFGSDIVKDAFDDIDFPQRVGNINNLVDFPSHWLKTKRHYKYNPETPRTPFQAVPIETFLKDPLNRDPKSYDIVFNFIIPKRYCIVVDFENFKLSDIIGSFHNWLSAEAKSSLRKTGKAASFPYDKLKCLAALRISKKGYSFRRIQAFLNEYMLTPPVQSSKNVLPIYDGSGAWTNAIKNANQIIRDCFK